MVEKIGEWSAHQMSLPICFTNFFHEYFSVGKQNKFKNTRGREKPKYILQNISWNWQKFVEKIGENMWWADQVCICCWARYINLFTSPYICMFIETVRSGLSTCNWTYPAEHFPFLTSWKREKWWSILLFGIFWDWRLEQRCR